MKKFLFLVVLLFAAKAAFAEGGSGTYFITGKAYATDGALLANKTLVVVFGNDTSRIVTDVEGNYMLAVRWIHACGTSAEEKQERNALHNPRWIVLSCEGRSARVENQWQKYASLADSEANALHLDLHFE